MPTPFATVNVAAVAAASCVPTRTARVFVPSVHDDVVWLKVLAGVLVRRGAVICPEPTPGPVNPDRVSSMCAPTSSRLSYLVQDI